MKLNDLTGKRFDRLVVEGIAFKKNNRIYWRCKCDCGNEKEVVGADLRRGHTNSCGCYRNEQSRKATLHDLTGEEFGYLEVIERDMNYQGHGSSTHWICKCKKCGTIKSISTTSLISQKVISCGCIHSKGEFQIAKLLNENGIKFIQEYKLPNHKNRRFDFAILNKNNKIVRLIEFDGI